MAKKKIKKKGKKIKATVESKKSGSFIKVPPLSLPGAKKKPKVPSDQLGSFGGVIFKSSKKATLIPQNISSSQSATWADHDRIGKKAVSEFLHEDLFKLTLDIVLVPGFGYKPSEMMLKIRQYVKEGKVYPLIIGGKNICSKMAIKDCSEAWDVITNKGKLMQATVSLSFEEVV